MQPQQLWKEMVLLRQRVGKMFRSTRKERNDFSKGLVFSTEKAVHEMHQKNKEKKKKCLRKNWIKLNISQKYRKETCTPLQ